MNTTVMTQKSMMHEDIETILGLKDMSEEEQGQFMEAVGALVIESAVLKFTISLLPEERSVFGEWLEAHQENSALLELALEKYPLFAEIVNEEMNAFQSETKRLFGVA